MPTTLICALLYVWDFWEGGYEHPFWSSCDKLVNFAFNTSGIDTNETIKVFGGGGADPDRDRNGDLYVTVKVLNSIVWKLEVGSHLFFIVNTLN